MNRREVIKNLAIAATGTLFLSSCSEKSVLELLSDGRLNLDRRHKNYLKKISETFLPLTDLYDKIEHPADFIVKMINDCNPPENIAEFAIGFEKYKRLMATLRLEINDVHKEGIIAVAENVMRDEEPDEELAFFIGTVKGLSIYNLTSSEYYMTEYQEYQLVPKKYIACLKVEDS